MHNPESVVENETNRLRWDFEIQISARQPDLIVINKKEWTCRVVDLAVLADYRVKLKKQKEI